MHRPNVLKALSAFCLLSLVIYFSSCSGDDGGEEPVVTAEDVFVNEVYSTGEDWIELYNASDVTKDIGGYKIYDDPTKKYSIPNGTSIPAKGFIVFVCDDSGVGLNTNFKLTSSGETVYLENKSGTLIDKVEFPAMNDGQSYGRYPDGSLTLAVSGNTTRGASNGASQGPAISEVIRTPLVPELDESVIVQAKLVSNANISTVKLFYRLNGGAFTEVAMTLAGAYYNGTIPAQNTTGKVDYYVEAKNAANLTSTSPADAPSDTYSYLLNTDALPQLVINEFLAANTNCCPDMDSGTQEFDDWIEIYNAGATAVNIAGMYLSDDDANPFNSKIPSDNPTLTTIQPGGHLVIWADGQKSQGPLHVDFSLASAGEDVALFYIDGRPVDVYTYPAQSENVSTGRITDGASTWKTFSTPTQGASNE